jgi:RimJ/RimL family protein N-acetyltransferase
MFGGPYPTLESWQAAVDAWSKTTDPLCYAVVLPSGEGGKGGETVVGLMSFMNIVPDHRRLEIGSIIFGDALKRTRAATEAFYLTMRHAFDDLGYARFEWKANHLNAPSLAAADRLGFTFEGTFRYESSCLILPRRRECPH